MRHRERETTDRLSDFDVTERQGWRVIETDKKKENKRKIENGERGC